jgi:hypothetical protein
LSSWARAFIAARSASVNFLDFLVFAVVLLADFCVPFFAGFLSAITKHLLRMAQLKVPSDEQRASALDVQRLRVLPVDPVADAAQPHEVAKVLRRGGLLATYEIMPLRAERCLAPLASPFGLIVRPSSVR